MLAAARHMTCISIQGELDKAAAQRALDEQSARVHVAGIPLSKDKWPVAQCDIHAVFADDDGTRLELQIRDWTVVGDLQIGTTIKMVAAQPPDSKGAGAMAM